MTVKRILLSLMLLLPAVAVQASDPKAGMMVNLGHTSIIMDICISPDGTLLLTAGGDGLVKIWDCASFREVRSFACPDGIPRIVRFSPDGKMFASASEGIIRVQMTSDFSTEKTLKGHTVMVKDAVFSPDGKTLVSGDKDGVMIVWDLAEGKVLKKISLGKKEVFNLSFSGDGSALVAAAGDSAAFVFDTAKWKKRGEVAGEFLRHAVLSNDGKTVICNTESKLKVADISGKIKFEEFIGRLKLLVHGAENTSVCIATDEGKIVLYDYSEGKIISATEKLKKKWEDPYVSSAACSLKSGEAVFTDYSSFYAVDMQKGIKTRQFKGDALGVKAVRYLRKVNRIIAGYDYAEKASIADLSSPSAPVTVIPDGAPFVVYPDEKTIAAAGFHSLQKHDTVSGKTIGVISQYVYDGLCADMSPDGKYVAVSCSDKTVWFNPAADVFAIRKLADTDGAVLGLAFSPDSTKLLGCGGSKAVLWNTADEGKRILVEDRKHSFTAAAFSSDGKLISLGAKDGTVSVHRADSGAPLFSASCSSYVRALKFSSDGHLLICGAGDGIVRVFSVPDGNLRFSCSGHSGSVNALDLLPEQSFLSGSSDGSIKVWSLADGAFKGTVFLSPGGYSVITWDGRYDGSDKGLEMMHWAAGSEVIPLADFGQSFRDRGLLAKLLNGGITARPAADFSEARKKVEEEKKDSRNSIDVTRRLIGKIHSVKGDEIVVSYAGTGHISAIKDRYFIVMENGERLYLESVFPMMSSTKCRAVKASSVKIIRKGMPVFK